MKKTINSWLLCLCFILLPFCFPSCSSDGEDGIGDGAKSNCTIIVAGKEYFADPLISYFHYDTNHNNCIGYDNKPLYSSYSIWAMPVDDNERCAKWISISVHIPNFDKGFAVTKENTTLTLNDASSFPDPYYLLSSGSAIVTSFNSTSCTTEFRDCIFQNVENGKQIKINGKLIVEIE